MTTFLAEARRGKRYRELKDPVRKFKDSMLTESGYGDRKVNYAVLIERQWRDQFIIRRVRRFIGWGIPEFAENMRRTAEEYELTQRERVALRKERG